MSSLEMTVIFLLCVALGFLVGSVVARVARDWRNR